MWADYFKFGDVEIANSARAFGYSRTADCPANWLQGKPWGGIDSYAPGPYLHSAIQSAPWFDVSDPASERFFGVYVLEAEMMGSTRSGTIVEGVADGGVVTRVRRSGRRVVVRAWLTGDGLDALESGMLWLSAVLDGRNCPDGTYGPRELEFFLDAPPVRAQGESDADFNARVSAVRRHLSDVTCISGPLEVETRKASSGHWGRLVEFILFAEIPWILSDPVAVDAPPTPPILVDDQAKNLVPYPDAGIAGAPVVVSTNLCTNPSLEVDNAGWVYGEEGGDFCAFTSAGRVTGELAAAGTASFRYAVLGDGATEDSGTTSFGISHDVTLAGDDRRYSVSIWAATLILAGDDSAVGSVSLNVEWLDASFDSLGSVLVDARDAAPGQVLSGSSLLPAAGSVTARVTLIFEDVVWRSSATPANNSEIRMYADALALTWP